MNRVHPVRPARRWWWSVGFATTLAGLLVTAGTRDLESYEHAFVSLSRGTAMQTVQILGHPVYTSSLGFGVRLPLQGSFGASPVALMATFLPAPITYWLMLAFSIAAALLVVRSALEDEYGPSATSIAAVLLFCSVPMATATILNDWPDVAFTYCAFVACAFAPQALLRVMAVTHGRARVLGMLSLAGVVFGAIAVAHAGYWPHIALTLVGAGVLALLRPDYPWRDRMVALGCLAAVAIAATATQAPDFLRELDVPGADTASLGRYTEPPEGTLIGANLFPFGEIGSRLPFSHLVLALVTLGIGLTITDAIVRRVAIAAAVLSILFGIGATIPVGTSAFSPTSIWSLRDPAAAFAVFGAVATSAAVRRGGVRIPGRPALVALLVAALQGPAYAATLVLAEGDQWTRFMTIPGSDVGVWTRDLRPPEERVYERGFPRDIQRAGQRIALWPGVRSEMRNDRSASTDFADAGFVLTTAWTKQRTMRGLVRPNELLFNQVTDLSPEVLCDSAAVEFLRLRFLLARTDAAICSVWTRRPGVVDGKFALYNAAVRDDRVRAVPRPEGDDPLRFDPALVPRSSLIRALEPVPDTSLRVLDGSIFVESKTSLGTERALVLPVAWDSAWQSSDGRIENAGGLLAVAGAGESRVTLRFVPDSVAWLRAVAMTVAQVAALMGLVGLVYVRR